MNPLTSDLWERLFGEVLRMSWLGSLTILMVLALRIPMKKLPKRFSYILWSAVWLRLILPVSLPSSFSFLGFISNGSSIPEHGIGSISSPALPVPLDRQALDSQLLQFSSLQPQSPVNSIDPIQVFYALGTAVWIIGFLALLSYSVFTYILTARRLATATRIAPLVFESDRVDSPFVFGFLKPRIVVPTGISPEALKNILSHEYVHLQRRDYLLKPLTYLITLLHWFNPLVWIAFHLTSKDMEMSCDEQVIRDFSMKDRGVYSQTLLGFSTLKKHFVHSPLAFGESNVKTRILNVLHYRVLPFWAYVICGVLVVGLFIGLITTPQYASGEDMGKATIPVEKNAGYDIKGLLENHTPYVGNNSKVVALTDAVPYPKGVQRGMVSLHTDQEPYGMTVDLIMSEETLKYFNDKGQLLKNAALMFAFIDNLDYMDYRMMTVDQRLTEASPLAYDVYPLNRKSIEKMIGEPLSGFTRDQKGIMDIIQHVTDAQGHYQETDPAIPDYVYHGNDLSTQVVQSVFTEKMAAEYQDRQGEGSLFNIAAPTIHKTVEEKGVYKVFATVYGSRFMVYGKTVKEIGGQVIPIAITYEVSDRGFTVKTVETAGDGSEFGPSINAFCTMPQSKTPIEGLYDTIMADYSNEGQAKRQGLMGSYLKEQLETYRKGTSFELIK